MSSIKPQVAPELKEGLFASDIKQIPKVKAFLEAIIDEERNKAFEQGYQDGIEKGKAKAYQQSKSEYDQEFQTHLEQNKTNLESIIKSLAQPVPKLADDVTKKIVNSFNQALIPVLTDPSIYDTKLKIQIDEIVANAPENNREVHIQINSTLQREFLDYFNELSKSYGATVEVIEMSDLVRLITNAGSFRFSHQEHIERVLHGDEL